MDKLHRYALDENGNTIFIKNVTHDERHNKFYCKNCGGLMIPVLGEKRQKHFRHKVVTPTCSYESYIHKIGKEKLRERFYNQETFFASYYIGFACDKTNNCKFREKLANLECNKKEKRTIDLKKLYDTCEEEKKYKGYIGDLVLTHSEHPEREPIFIEIAYTHDCTKEKLKSGIQIIEVKVNDDQDFSMSFDEPNLMFFDFENPNPYTFYKAPQVRFYNFPRCNTSSIPLSRFVVFKNHEGIIEGLNVPETTCQNFDNEHVPGVYYELVTSEEIMRKDRNMIVNVYAYGLAMAMKKGYPVKHCVFCQRFYQGFGGCLVNGKLEYKDLNTNQIYKRPVSFWNSLLRPQQIDRAAIASKCHIFIPNQSIVDKLLKYYQDVPFWDWDNKEALTLQT